MEIGTRLFGKVCTKRRVPFLYEQILTFPDKMKNGVNPVNAQKSLSFLLKLH